MKIYRVERRDHFGPYMGGSNAVCVWASNRHPSPIEDVGIDRRIQRDERCGFTSKRGLKSWFLKRTREDLHEEGYYLAVYDVPRDQVTRGEKQALFRWSQKYFVGREPLVPA